MKQIVLFTQGLVLIEALAATAAICTWRKWKDGYLKGFIFYLPAITLLEAAHYVFENQKNYATAMRLGEISVAVEMLFISWLFYKMLYGKSKKIPVAGAATYLTILIIEKITVQAEGYFFRSLSYTVGNLFILVYLISFFIQLAKNDRLLQFKKLTVFWIAAGMLLFYLGTFPFYGLYNELAKDIPFFISVAWFATFLNYCMYLFFTIGFIWGKPG
jgi:hypothetical protein